MTEHWAWTAEMSGKAEVIHEQAMRVPQLAEMHASVEKRIPFSHRRRDYQLKNILLQHRKSCADTDEACEDEQGNLLSPYLLSLWLLLAYIACAVCQEVSLQESFLLS